MTKKQMIKRIIELEYTNNELQNDKGLYKARYNDLAKYNKPFLQERIEYLSR